MDNNNYSFYESETFKKLEKEWYSKLKKSGFKDIENDDTSMTVTSPTLNPYKKKSRFEISDLEEWYRVLGVYGNYYKFPKNIKKYKEPILLVANEGISIREAATRSGVVINALQLYIYRNRSKIINFVYELDKQHAEEDNNGK